jgi:hypothetical protein
MPDKQFKERCEQLTAVIKNTGRSDIFKRVCIKEMVYIYNTLAGNIIYKYRHTSGTLGIQYRPTSIYAEHMKTVVPSYISGLTIRRLASPNMVRHVRDVRARI